MKKGFSIKCLECNEEMVIKPNFKKDKDESKLGLSIFGAYPYYSLYMYCVSCKNEVEIEY